jgi:hypothetical protein
VEPCEGHVHLADEQMHIVAGVPDKRDSLGIARHVPGTSPELGEEQLRGIVAIEQVRAANGTTTVEGLEVDARAAKVLDAVGVGVVRQRRAIGGDVVGDELTEYRPYGRERTVVSIVDRCEWRTVAGTAAASEGVQLRLVDDERFELREQPGVSAARHGRVDSGGR